MLTQVAVTGGSDTSLGSSHLAIRDLGVIAYQECWERQRALAAAVLTREEPETLLLLEHPHTYTCGRSGGRGHILVGEAELASLGATVLDVDRGGDVTYHGPGQLVGYPIINLFSNRIGRDYRAYVRALEEVLINLLADYAIPSYRIDGLSGVWVDDFGNQAKIAAIGVKVDGRGVTTHGIALNVGTDLAYFNKIIPCGIADKGVTSMARLLRYTPDLTAVKLSFTNHFRRVFGYGH
jgi:lipoyl(octanoyl) transferase